MKVPGMATNTVVEVVLGACRRREGAGVYDKCSRRDRIELAGG
jgi:hypothetical protein